MIHIKKKCDKNVHLLRCDINSNYVEECFKAEDIYMDIDFDGPWFSGNLPQFQAIKCHFILNWACSTSSNTICDMLKRIISCFPNLLCCTLDFKHNFEDKYLKYLTETINSFNSKFKVYFAISCDLIGDKLKDVEQDILNFQGYKMGSDLYYNMKNVNIRKDIRMKILSLILNKPYKPCLTNNIKRLKGLESIHIQSTSKDSFDFYFLKYATSIKNLSISFLHHMDKSLGEMIGNMPYLEKLYIHPHHGSWDKVSVLSLTEGLQKHKSIKNISININNELQPLFYKDIEGLSIQSCEFFYGDIDSFRSFATFVSKTPTLNYLKVNDKQTDIDSLNLMLSNFKGCLKIYLRTSKILKDDYNRGKRLEAPYLESLVTEKYMLSLFKHGSTPMLKSVEFLDTYLDEDEEYDNFINDIHAISNLEHFNMNWPRENFRPDYFFKKFRGLPHLKSLKLKTNKSYLNQEDLIELAKCVQRCPKLEDVYVILFIADYISEDYYGELEIEYEDRILTDEEYLEIFIKEPTNYDQVRSIIYQHPNIQHFTILEHTRSSDYVKPWMTEFEDINDMKRLFVLFEGVQAGSILPRELLTMIIERSGYSYNRVRKNWVLSKTHMNPN